MWLEAWRLVESSRPFCRDRFSGRLESGVDSETLAQAPTPDTGGLDDFNAFHGAKQKLSLTGNSSLVNRAAT